MTTGERLAQYYDFSTETVDRVSEAADWQNQHTFSYLSRAYQLDESLETIKPQAGDKPLEVVTFKPRQSFDPTHMRVYHLPMGNALSPNMIMNGMRLFEADPTEQLMLVGNPSRPGSNAGRIGLKAAVHVARHKDLSPVNMTLLHHLQQLDITSVDHIGYSYGADKAAAAAATSAQAGQQVRHGVFVEPVAIADRSMPRLARRFGYSARAISRYVNQANSEPYQAVRDQESRWSFLSYSLGLARTTNVAVALALGKATFAERVEEALESQSDMKVAVGWGTASELTLDEPMQRISGELRQSFGNERVRALRLQGMRHAGGNDIDLHAAIILEGLRD
jgi:pimeloyl-ACP methyl ester carboxylesterase